jgi:hypothetical protein
MNFETLIFTCKKMEFNSKVVNEIQESLKNVEKAYEERCRKSEVTYEVLSRVCSI